MSGGINGRRWDGSATEHATINEPCAEAKEDSEFTPYAMTERFTKGQLILHPKFGKGIVMDVETARVEILFQEGKKKLGHGQS